MSGYYPQSQTAATGTAATSTAATKNKTSNKAWNTGKAVGTLGYETLKTATDPDRRKLLTSVTKNPEVQKTAKRTASTLGSVLWSNRGTIANYVKDKLF